MHVRERFITLFCMFWDGCANWGHTVQEQGLTCTFDTPHLPWSEKGGEWQSSNIEENSSCLTSVQFGVLVYQPVTKRDRDYAHEKRFLETCEVPSTHLRNTRDGITINRSCWGITWVHFSCDSMSAKAQKRKFRFQNYCAKIAISELTVYMPLQHERVRKVNQE